MKTSYFKQAESSSIFYYFFSLPLNTCISSTIFVHVKPICAGLHRQS